MKTLLILFILVFSFLNPSTAQKAFTKKMQNQIEKFESIEAKTPLKVSPNSRSFDELSMVTNLSLDKSFIEEISNERSILTKLNIPLNSNQNINILLEEANIFGDDFSASYSSNKNIESIKNNLYYWGIVEGYPNSMVSLTVTKNEIISVIAINDKVYNLGKLANEESYVVYEKNDLINPPSTSCFSEDVLDFSSETIVERVVPGEGNCVNMYVEVDNDIYANKGANTLDYITAVFSQVSLLYSNESINLLLGELVIWDTSDPYPGPSSSDYLNQFRNTLNGSFNGDLAHLVGYGGGGGVAYVNVLCNSTYGIGYSGINSNYSNVPAYSWTIEVLTHEIGHNLGSPHTHSCSWNGNNTQIDDCGNVYLANNGGSTGSCYDSNNQILPSAGTIMSYCHLVSGIGIDFNNGFGPQPGDLIRGNVYNASCLVECGPCEPGTSCDDLNDCTTGDTYDENCDCVGTIQDSDGDGVCDADDVCSGFDDTIDGDGDGIPDGCDDCFNEVVSFTQSSLTHSGAGSSTSSVSFSTYTADASFTISGLNSRTGGNPNNRFIDQAIVSYVDVNGSTIVYGTYLGTNASTVDININNLAGSISVELSDAYDGNSNTTLSVSLSDIETCPTTDCPDADGDGVCDVDDQCPGGDDNLDLNGNGIPDDCESNCIQSTGDFSANPLNHSGTGSTQTSYSFTAGDEDVSFTISDIGSKINGNPSNRYIDLVSVSYIDGNGNNQTYGTYQGDQVSSASINITGAVLEVTVALSDAYDGNSGNISVSFSTIDYCSIPATSESNQNINLNGLVNIYPNPFKDNVQITVNETEANYFSVSVYDISGQVIIKQTRFENKQFNLGLSEISSGGMYIVKIVSDLGESYTQRIICVK